jgi:hypothetical protein
MNSWVIDQSKSLMKLSRDVFLMMKLETLSRTELWNYVRKEHLELSHGHRSIGTCGATCCVRKYFRQWQQINRNTAAAFNWKGTHEVLYQRFNRERVTMRARRSLSVSTVKLVLHCISFNGWHGKDSMIFLGRHGESPGPNLMGNK